MRLNGFCKKGGKQGEKSRKTEGKNADKERAKFCSDLCYTVCAAGRRRQAVERRERMDVTWDTLRDFWSGILADEENKLAD